MRGEHEVAGGQMEFLLSMHFTDEGEREVLTKAMKERYEDFAATGVATMAMMDPTCKCLDIVVGWAL